MNTQQARGIRKTKQAKQLWYGYNTLGDFKQDRAGA